MSALPKGWSLVIASLALTILPGFGAIAVSELVDLGEGVFGGLEAREPLRPAQAEPGSVARKSPSPRLGEAQLLRVAGAAPAPHFDAQPASEGPHSEGPHDAPHDAPAACPATLRLMGSVVNTRKPERSLAAIRVRSGMRLLHIGERIDQLTLIALRPRRAYLRDERGAVCELPVLPGSGGASAAAAAPAPKARKGQKASRGPDEAALKNGIRQLDANTYAVSRTLLTSLLGDPTSLRKSGRFRVRSEGGKVVGLELYSLRRSPTLRLLGLKKGDVVRKLNGHDLSNPADALALMKTVQSGSRFSLALLRGGKPETIDYVLR